MSLETDQLSAAFEELRIRNVDAPKPARLPTVEELEHIIGDSNPWVELVPNTKEASIERLSPTAVSGTLTIPVGRIHKMNLGEEYLTCFTVGDQLLWGAAEPIRRILKIILEHSG